MSSNRLFLSVMFTFLLIFIAIPACSGVLYVTDDGSGKGTSWKKGFGSQEVLELSMLDVNDNTQVKHTGYSLWAWGNNASSQLGDGTDVFIESPQKVGTDKKWRHVTGDSGRSFAIKDEGTLWAWGLNIGLGIDSEDRKIFSPEQVGTSSNWSLVDSASLHALALKEDGSLWAWGDNRSGQLGDGTREDQPFPVRITGDYDWVKISASSNGTLALKDDGSLWGWGSSFLFGYPFENRIVPTRIDGDYDWMDISLGNGFAVALKTDGTLWSWGANSFGQLGDGTFEDSEDKYKPRQVGEYNDWVNISAGAYHTLALRSDGGLWTWGNNKLGQLGDGTLVNRNVPTKINIDHELKHIKTGHTFSMARKEDGSLWFWGENRFNIGDSLEDNITFPLNTNLGSNWDSIYFTSRHILGIQYDSSLWSWGSNTFGELGHGVNIHSYSPKKITEDLNWTSVTAGHKHSMAISNSEDLFGWGGNYYGQLGNGTKNKVDIPQLIDNITGISRISAGHEHTIVIKNDGSLWSWGWNNFGQLGINSTDDMMEPFRVGNTADWQSISAGGAHSMALKSDGTLWGWGLNSSGQLGNASKENKHHPVLIDDETSWVVISAGFEHTLALKNDGSLWSWGNNIIGQLGDGTGDNIDYPRQVGTDKDWMTISTTAYHSVAVKYDGSLWSWGDNSRGQIGDGTNENRFVPVRIGNDNDWSEVFAGYDNTFALKQDGTLWAWGANSSGQLGTGNTVDSSINIPTQVGSDKDWVTLTSGGSHVLALKKKASHKQTGTPSFIQVPSSSDTGNFTISWGRSSTSEVTYVLEEATSEDFTENLRTAYTGPRQNTTISGKSDGTYYYRVKATKDGYQDSEWRVGSNGCVVSTEAGDTLQVQSGFIQIGSTFSDVLSSAPSDVSWYKIFNLSESTWLGNTGWHRADDMKALQIPEPGGRFAITSWGPESGQSDFKEFTLKTTSDKTSLFALISKVFEPGTEVMYSQIIDTSELHDAAYLRIFDNHVVGDAWLSKDELAQHSFDVGDKPARIFLDTYLEGYGRSGWVSGWRTAD